MQNKPVVCQVCHYTPALDLAQVGPKAGAPGTEGNGRNQIAHQSNSRVMHSHHGTLGTAGFPGLFPQIPSPIQDANGNITNQTTRLAALEDSCYQCHPGTNTKCLRGAMFNGGMLCNDCHGSMVQVGNDFSRSRLARATRAAFILADQDFYTNPASNQPRPWANEPGCGSCHTGDASSNLADRHRCHQEHQGHLRQHGQHPAAPGVETATSRRRPSCPPTRGSRSPRCRPRFGRPSPTRVPAIPSCIG